MFSEQEHKESILRKKPVIAVVVLACLVAASIFWLFSQMHAADKALDLFVENLTARNYDAAYSSTTDEFQRALSKQQFIDQQTALCSKFGILKSVEHYGRKTTLDSRGSFTTIDATLVFDKAECPFLFKLKKVSGTWRVYGYRGRA